MEEYVSADSNSTVFLACKRGFVVWIAQYAVINRLDAMGVARWVIEGNVPTFLRVSDVLGS